MTLVEEKETQAPGGFDTRGRTETWIAALRSNHLEAVQQRVLRQLIQALVFERIPPCQIQSRQDSALVVLQGITADGEAVHYYAEGTVKHSFGLLRLRRQAVMRVVAGESATTATLADFVAEVLAGVTDASRLESFLIELEQTLLKDVQAQATVRPERLNAAQRRYDALEGHLMDAHAYHPCYKSRLGFSLADNHRYGPEFRQPIRLHWVALHKDRARMSASARVEYPAYTRYILGDADARRFAGQLEARDLRAEDYWLLPVHPWQWDERIATLFYPQLASDELVWLGTGSDDYRAQQSIRTLANARHPKKPYAKLALGITNTSTSRIMAAHTVLNGPVITDWLQRLIEHDPIARDMDFVILGEVLGVTCDYEALPAARRLAAYGQLGVVWRESLHKYLRPGEDAVPFNGLCHCQADGEPLIADWVRRYGIEPWTRQLLAVSVGPIIHMLFGHGIGMESHGQNIVLIHDNGWPKRIALKDFHDGVRYSRAHLSEPEACPTLHAVPLTHARINPNSYLETDDPHAVRDYSCDAFFFIALAELGLFLNQHCDLAETDFWRLTAGVVHDYQSRHPEHRERFECFDVFADTFEVEELTKRRLLGDGAAGTQAVVNPLAAFAREVAQ